MQLAVVASASRLLGLGVLMLIAGHSLLDTEPREWLWYGVIGCAGVSFAIDSYLWTIGEYVPIGYFSFPTTVLVSVCAMVSVALIGGRAGLFEGGDMKAITLVAVLFPVAPSFILPQTIPVVGGVTLPIYLSAAGLFSFAILCNTLIISWGLPLALGVANAVRGRFSPAMVVGVPRGLRDMKEDASVVGTSLPGVTSQWEDGEERTVSLLDAYLEWSGRSIKDIVSEGPNPQFEEVDRGANSVGGHGEIHTTDGGYLDHSDDWGAVRFVQETGVEVPPGEVRSMLDTLNSRGDEDMTVWVKLQLPFLVPLVLGTVVSLTLGNVLIAILLSL